MIRHVTSIDNVENKRVIDPLKIRHCVITASRIADLSGWIDPVTHLNLDFFSHLVSSVVVAEKLEKNAKIIIDGNEFMYAQVDSSAYDHYGEVDVVGRTDQMRRNIHAMDDRKKKPKNTK